MAHIDKTFTIPAFSRQSGRIRIEALLYRLGDDVHITLAGGSFHLGAVAMASPDGQDGLMQAAGHKEGEISHKMACRLATELGCNVAVCAGIHYEDITDAEIDLATGMCDLLTDDIIDFLRLGAIKPATAGHPAPDCL